MVSSLEVHRPGFQNRAAPCLPRRDWRGGSAGQQCGAAVQGGAGSESADASDADAQALTPAAAGPAAAASQEVQAPETHAEATEGRALSPSGGGGDTTTLSSSSVWKRPFHQPEARERSPLPGPSILPARPTFMSPLASRRTATTGGPSPPAPWCEGEGRPQTTEPFTEDFSRTVARAWAAWRELSQPSVRAAGRAARGWPPCWAASPVAEA